MKVDVVLIDGNELARRGARSVLASAGMKIVGEAADGPAGLRLIERTKPRVIVVAARLVPYQFAEFFCLIPAESRPAVVALVDTAGPCPPRLAGLGVRALVATENAAATLPDAVRAVAEGGEWYAPGLCMSMATCEASSTPVHLCPRLSALSGREREVFILACHGYNNAEIGRALFISPRTVEVHRTRSFRKLSVDSLSGAIAFAKRLGLFAFEPAAP